jgi:hypothetical protein
MENGNGETEHTAKSTGTSAGLAVNNKKLL